MTLQGKAAWVTGGSRGIGRGIALALAQAGADLAVADLDIAGAEAAATEVRDLGRRAIGLRVDVTSAADVEAMARATVEAFGRLDITVNCAGIISVSPLESLAEAEWDRIMDVNAKGVFLCCKAALPALRRAGGGRIINVASIAGKRGAPNLAHYCASKFAVVGLTSALAREVARDNITVNAICPGIVRTHMWDLLSDARRQGDETAEEAWQRSVLALIPQGRPQTPEDMGALAVYLATAENLTGQAINLDGGIT
jgi:meso-butanediol dehydrogenase/(S,S)-butanediol dehydrogenase/diacetyl reductase